eukprot:scaffold27511_cov32-Tisochrysis_lutea.AAC.3
MGLRQAPNDERAASATVEAALHVRLARHASTLRAGGAHKLVHQFHPIRPPELGAELHVHIDKKLLKLRVLLKERRLLAPHSSHRAHADVERHPVDKARHQKPLIVEVPTEQRSGLGILKPDAEENVKYALDGHHVGVPAIAQQLQPSLEATPASPQLATHPSWQLSPPASVLLAAEKVSMEEAANRAPLARARFTLCVREEYNHTAGPHVGDRCGRARDGRRAPLRTAHDRMHLGMSPHPRPVKMPPVVTPAKGFPFPQKVV